ncbi:MAG: hypothetical protein KC680_04560 [Candidatus Peregrinibacteria bacterium]|nr:hypothetical protein [Candidatus Peregrinibacteria bacterium]MCB9808554.1 hypothetical protein [Candidatus Peribacteria bacterium]
MIHLPEGVHVEELDPAIRKIVERDEQYKEVRQQIDEMLNTPQEEAPPSAS